jgi:hypothetical protein
MVQDAVVILVAVSLGSTPAPPNVKGDLPEVFIRWHVSRMLKGEFADAIITTRAMAWVTYAEVSDKEWILILSPEFFAGFPYVSVAPRTEAEESEIKALLAQPPEENRPEPPASDPGDL